MSRARGVKAALSLAYIKSRPKVSIAKHGWYLIGYLINYLAAFSREIFAQVSFKNEKSHL